MFNQFLMSNSDVIICQFFLFSDLFFSESLALEGFACLNTLRKKHRWEQSWHNMSVADYWLLNTIWL